MTRASLLAAAVFAAVPALTAGASTASADVIRVGGSARIRVGGGIRVRTPRVHWRPHRYYYGPRRVYVGGAVWVGGGYYDYRWAAPPPPPPPPCDCQGGSYYPAPVAATPAPVVVAASAPPRLPRLGIGAFVGGSEVDDSREGGDVGLLGRFRLTRGLILEGELTHTELEHHDGVERRGGGALLYEFGASNRWAPYLLIGAGVSQVEREDDTYVDTYETARAYGEVGVGLRWAVTERFHLAVDIRAGGSSAVEEDDGYYADVAADPKLVPDDDGYEDEEEYTRSRLSAVLYF